MTVEEGPDEDVEVMQTTTEEERAASGAEDSGMQVRETRSTRGSKNVVSTEEASSHRQMCSLMSPASSKSPSTRSVEKAGAAKKGKGPKGSKKVSKCGAAARKEEADQEGVEEEEGCAAEQANASPAGFEMEAKEEEMGAKVWEMEAKEGEEKEEETEQGMEVDVSVGGDEVGSLNTAASATTVTNATNSTEESTNEDSTKAEHSMTEPNSAAAVGSGGGKLHWPRMARRVPLSQQPDAPASEQSGAQHVGSPSVFVVSTEEASAHRDLHATTSSPICKSPSTRSARKGGAAKKGQKESKKASKKASAAKEEEESQEGGEGEEEGA
eukprot:2871295-Rhodomonas_salina.1